MRALTWCSFKCVWSLMCLSGPIIHGTVIHSGQIIHSSDDLPHNWLCLNWPNLLAPLNGLHSSAKNIIACTSAQTVPPTACFFDTGKEQKHATVTSIKESDCDCVLYMWWFLTAYVDCSVSTWELKHGSRRCAYVLAIFNYTVLKGEQMRELQDYFGDIE